MSNAKSKAAEKIKRNLFLPTKEIREEFSEMELQRKKRMMLCVTKKLDDPIISDRELVEYLTTGCDGTVEPVSSSTAYRDLLLINDITGNIRLASKDWERYMVVETAKAEISHWRKKDGKAVASLLGKIIEVRRLDQEDQEDFLDKMVPFEPVITHDPSVLGDDFEPIADVDKKRKELREFFNKKNTTDIDHEELKDEETI